MDVGEDTGTAVFADYTDQMPFAFTGKLDKVTIELAPIPGNMKADAAHARQDAEPAIRLTN
ncbi:hypothetical protein AWB80_01118 [Caballeronia pedi]|uniref:Uncharacterized protein n=1 Tax=Caballeronia pedi TaxID=1777141 RepID=A0A157ZRI9_9BURK|nr:hypothetical protein AWB80_01118 [Caballeronia pedi]